MQVYFSVIVCNVAQVAQNILNGGNIRFRVHECRCFGVNIVPKYLHSEPSERMASQVCRKIHNLT